MIDIAEKDVAQAVKEGYINLLLDNFKSARVSNCKICKKETTLVLGGGGYHQDAHIIFNPCTRIVVGIYPEIRFEVEESTGKNVSFGWGEIYYFCTECRKWNIPELVAEAVPDLRALLKDDPIIDMTLYNKSKGCWITVTEFPLDWRGRFLNYQTDFRNFVKIFGELQELSPELGLVDPERLASHLVNNVIELSGDDVIFKLSDRGLEVIDDYSHSDTDDQSSVVRVLVPRDKLNEMTVKELIEQIIKNVDRRKVKRKVINI